MSHRGVPQQEVWEMAGVIVADTPNPRDFPAVRIQVRMNARPGDRSYKDGFRYTFGLVEARDDAMGRTFRPQMHIPDAQVVSYLDLLRKAATLTNELAGKADKEDSGKLTGNLGAIAASKPKNASKRFAR